MQNPHIETLTTRLPLLHQLHQLLNDGEDMSLYADPDIARILVPHSRYDHQPLHRTLSEIANERAEIYIHLIGLQYRMAKVGMARVRTLMGMFDFYVRDILGRDPRFAQMDIYQQATDVSLMYIINNSQLKFVAALIGESDPRYISAKKLFDRQDREFDDFQKIEMRQLDRIIYKDLGDITKEQRLTYLLQYEMTALDVADYNIELALHTGRLIENGARARYYWNSSLSMTRGSKNVAAKFLPNEDLQYDAEIQKMYLERCGILLDRAVLVYKLADKLSV